MSNKPSKLTKKQQTSFGVQTTFQQMPSASFPTWLEVKLKIESLPRGKLAPLARHLHLTPSGLSKLLCSPNEPRYSVVLAALDYLAMG